MQHHSLIIAQAWKGCSWATLRKSPSLRNCRWRLATRQDVLPKRIRMEDRGGGQWLSNACPLAPKNRTNRKGDISFETSPSQSDFSKFWFGPDHNVYSPGITRAPRACAHVSLILPLSQASQELPHFHLSGCPELSLVADPRRWWLVCSLPLEDCSSVEINATPRLREC